MCEGEQVRGGWWPRHTASRPSKRSFVRSFVRSCGRSVRSSWRTEGDSAVESQVWPRSHDSQGMQVATKEGRKNAGVGGWKEGRAEEGQAGWAGGCSVGLTEGIEGTRDAQRCGVAANPPSLLLCSICCV